jgi:hypothetical protein
MIVRKGFKFVVAEFSNLGRRFEEFDLIRTSTGLTISFHRPAVFGPEPGRFAGISAAPILFAGD